GSSLPPSPLPNTKAATPPMIARTSRPTSSHTHQGMPPPPPPAPASLAVVTGPSAWSLSGSLTATTRRRNGYSPAGASPGMLILIVAVWVSPAPNGRSRSPSISNHSFFAAPATSTLSLPSQIAPDLLVTLKTAWPWAGPVLLGSPGRAISIDV